MAQIKFKGNPVHTAGELPKAGDTAPDFRLTGTDLADISLASYSGKNLIISVFPSLDTPVCAASVRRFNVEAGKLKNTVVICVSRDLPFAHKRFCVAEGLSNVVSASEYRNASFSDGYGLRIIDGPLAGLLSRAIIVIDATGKILYTEQVPEITQEPDYDRALAILSTV